MTELAGMTAVILAGGFGTRLRSVVVDRPKVLADVGGRPFVTRLLDQLSRMGIRRSVFCAGYLGRQMEEMLGDTYGDLDLVYSHEPIPLGTAGALRLARPLFHSDPVLVMNGDSYCHANLQALLDWHVARNAQASLLLTEVPDTKRYGGVWTKKDGLVSRFTEKGHEGGPGWINAGIYALSHCFVEAIPCDRAISLEHDIFPAWIGRGLYGYRDAGPFLDIGIPEAYAEASSFFASKWQ